MNQLLNATCVCKLALIIALIVPAGPAGADDVYTFRVAFEEIPGTKYLAAGDLARGIQVLEQDLVSGTSNEGHVVATLCGAYILSQQLVKAERTCTDAVRRFPGNAAYNNRGVLRALRGNFEGSRRDFDRASPSNMEEYMEILRTQDIGLVAGSNSELLEELSARHSPDDIGPSYTSAKGADIEILDH